MTTRTRNQQIQYALQNDIPVFRCILRSIKRDMRGQYHGQVVMQENSHGRKKGEPYVTSDVQYVNMQERYFGTLNSLYLF